MTIVEQAMKIPGSTNQNELNILEEWSRKYIKDSACEIGCEYGRSTYVIGSVCKERNAKFYVLDKQNALNDILGYIPMEFLLGDSKNTYKFVPDVDFCFIDGDHKMPTVFYDIVNMYPKSKFICGHDYRNMDKSDSEVKIVVDNLEIMRGARNEVHAHSLWWKEK